MAFWKRVNKMEAGWIPNNCNHHFALPNDVSHPFWTFLASLTQNNAMACLQIEPELIQCHKTLPIIGTCRFQESE
jgi:hypothetical protein